MLFRKSKTPPPPPEESPQRDIPVAIPARYVLRLNHAQFWLGLGFSLFLVLFLPAVFWDLRGAEGGFGGIAVLFGLFLLMSAGLLAQYFLASITVNREGFSLRWWPRRRRDGSLFCQVPGGMENSQFLALFLADSGLPFTYPPA